MNSIAFKNIMMSLKNTSNNVKHATRNGGDISDATHLQNEVVLDKNVECSSLLSQIKYRPIFW